MSSQRPLVLPLYAAARDDRTLRRRTRANCDDEDQAEADYRYPSAQRPLFPSFRQSLLPTPPSVVCRSSPAAEKTRDCGTRSTLPQGAHESNSESSLTCLERQWSALLQHPPRITDRERSRTDRMALIADALAEAWVEAETARCDGESEAAWASRVKRVKAELLENRQGLKGEIAEEEKEGKESDSGERALDHVDDFKAKHLLCEKKLQCLRRRCPWVFTPHAALVPLPPIPSTPGHPGQGVLDKPLPPPETDQPRRSRSTSLCSAATSASASGRPNKRSVLRRVADRILGPMNESDLRSLEAHWQELLANKDGEYSESERAAALRVCAPVLAARWVDVNTRRRKEDDEHWFATIQALADGLLRDQAGLEANMDKLKRKGAGDGHSQHPFSKDERQLQTLDAKLYLCGKKLKYLRRKCRWAFPPRVDKEEYIPLDRTRFVNTGPAWQMV